MSDARDEAYARLRASAPRPAIAGDAIDAFCARFTAQNGRCARLGAIEELPEWLDAQFAPADGSRLSVALAEETALEMLPWARAARLEPNPAGARPQAALAVTTAFAGVAETGALAVHPRRGTPMALNFLPERLVILVHADCIVATLEDFWQHARSRFGTAWPRGLCLVAGPSSSADIEMTFATGVHGPVEVHAVIV